MKKSLHFNARGVCFFGLLALFTLHSEAQETLPSNTVPYEGNWIVEFTNSPEKGKVETTFITLARRWQPLLNGKQNPGRNHPPESGALLTFGPVPESSLHGGDFGTVKPPFGNKLTFKHSYGVLGHWGGTSEVSRTGPNEIRGTWSYGEKRGETIMRRAIPRVTAVEFSSNIRPQAEEKYRLASDRVLFGEQVGKAEATYAAYGTMRGNMAQITIRVFGEHLWGHHVCWIEGTDLEVPTISHIPADKATPKPDHVIGLSLSVYAFSNASTGRKILHVDDIQIPFDLVMHDVPDAKKPKVPELRFVRFANDRYEPAAELRHGDEFCVEAVYSAKPNQPPGKVRLSWTDGQPREVEVMATEDAKLFRSARMKLDAPPRP
jgi:hypothetical protein